MLGELRTDAMALCCLTVSGLRLSPAPPVQIRGDAVTFSLCLYVVVALRAPDPVFRSHWTGS